ncbi:MAG TPA: undecaprenyldiphospho-muramoylpentapeptide beta-N-acetylglucosaminyltransferase [Acidiferrobacteraceae bacterium]|nr:undecaprenyldiphospho-muramoylpentapeptide beta-N-acetylglucosaminyltransferase [Acidiferrobacteraceae bacterium]
MKRALILAGGTGGHVFPALAVARALSQNAFEVVWVGTRKGIEARVVPAAGFPIEWITIQGLRRGSLLDWIRLPFRLAYAMWQAFRIIRRVRPHVALAMGGFASGPSALVAAMLRVPLVIHEQNATAGFTNRWLALVADEVLCGFPNAFGRLPGSKQVGNPVRPEIFALPHPDTRGIAAGRPLRLLVVGGSQGAAVFNKTVPEAVALMAPALRPEVWHQTGRLQAVQTENAYRHIPMEAHVTPFIEDMAAAYAWADIVVCRAGAMTIAELSAAGIAAVLVPFPRAADDHQTANARFLADRDAAVLLPQDQCTPQRLAELLQGFSQNPQALERMARQARACGAPDATARVAQYCVEAARA